MTRAEVLTLQLLCARAGLNSYLQALPHATHYSEAIQQAIEAQRQRITELEQQLVKETGGPHE